MGKVKGVLEAFIEAEVRDKEGNLIDKKRFRSRSFVANLLRLLRQMMMRYTTGATITNQYYVVTSAEPVDVGGTARSIAVFSLNANVATGIMLAGAIEGEDSFGIKVGMGTMTPTPTDYTLQSPINHGTGTNQLSYGSVTFDTIGISGNTTTLRIIRTFTNNSGSSITVSEIGLIVRIRTSGTSDSYAYILIARDVVSPSINVPNGSTLTIRYVLQTTA